MRYLLGVLTLAAAIACSNDTAPVKPIAEGEWDGTYALKSVNGEPLPHTWTLPTGGSVTIRGKTIYVHADRTWASFTRYSVTRGASDSTATETLTGTWTWGAPNRDVLLFTNQTPATYSGIIEGNALSLWDGIDAYRYSR